MTTVNPPAKNIAETIISHMEGTSRVEVVSGSEHPDSTGPYIIAAPDGMRLHDLTRQHREGVEALKPLQRGRQQFGGERTNAHEGTLARIVDPAAGGASGWQSWRLRGAARSSMKARAAATVPQRQRAP